MRQGGAPPTGKWVGSPTGGVKSPDPIILPDPTTRFAGTAARLDTLSASQPMGEWLCFLAELSRAQQSAFAALPSLTGMSEAELAESLLSGKPPLAAEQHRRDPAWRDGLMALLDAFHRGLLSQQAADAMDGLRNSDADAVEDFANAFLSGTIGPGEAAAALYVAAALQVYFTALASRCHAPSLQLLPERGLCPCCGSTPVAGVITASGQTPGTRYLYCSLCSTAWTHTRAICITCGDSRSLSLKGIEGDAGVVKAETCDACHTYAKMLYQAKDVQVDPFADDLSTLRLDVMVADAGWARHAPNPLLLVG